MSKQEPVDLDLGAFDKLDEAEMDVELNGRPTGWIWTFAGPGHPKAVAQASRMSRDRLRQDREKEQARTNGKKWKATDETPDEVRAENIRWIVERLLGWSPVRINGDLLAFSEAEATKLLSDPRKVGLLTQALEFLTDDASFTTRSSKA